LVDGGQVNGLQVLLGLSHPLKHKENSMPKYNDTPFVQLSRSIFHEDCKLSFRAKWLYTVLSELEHRYTGDKCKFFFRSQKDLKNDTGMTIKINIKYRQELIDEGYIKTWPMHWIDKETEKKSEKHVTAYQLLV
jgi:hypothetical protein